MSLLMNLLDKLGLHPISAQEIRAEVFALGGRHRGEVLKGARFELDLPGLPHKRTLLLNAVIRSIKHSDAHKADQ
jgi:hypothetical protein